MHIELLHDLEVTDISARVLNFIKQTNGRKYFVWDFLFGVYRPTREFFTHMET